MWRIEPCLPNHWTLRMIDMYLCTTAHTGSFPLQQKIFFADHLSFRSRPLRNFDKYKGDC